MASAKKILTGSIKEWIVGLTKTNLTRPISIDFKTLNNTSAITWIKMDQHPQTRESSVKT
jgi:hypothetical protein